MSTENPTVVLGVLWVDFGTISLGQGCKSAVLGVLGVKIKLSLTVLEVLGVKIKLTLTFRRFWGFGVQKRGNRCDFAGNPAFLNFKLLVFSYVFHTFEKKVLACTAPTRKFPRFYIANATI